MSPESDPPRKTYGFKPKNFERVNAPPAESDSSPAAPVPLANDIFSLQRDLREREKAAGLDEIAPPARPVRSRRKRDYWLLTLAFNGVLVPLALWGYRTQNAVIFVSCVAGLALVNVALAWLMWVLMRDY